MSDYGVYTNTVWNLGRGNGFKFLVDHSYLKTHLSFSLLLLGPLFALWNNPMLLIVVQWLFLVAGGLILWRIAVRLDLPAQVTWSILLFFSAYPFTQGVMLSEFHGVSSYLLLMPWLVYCLSFRRSWVFVPFLIILGVREDAAFLLPLVFVYYAVRHKWKGGYVYALAAVAYGVLAITVLYPAINHADLFAVRMGEEPAFGLLRSLTREGRVVRLAASIVFLMPVIACLVYSPKGWKPLFIFPAAAYLIAMCSGIPRQYVLSFHYPAALVALTAPAMLLTCHAARPGAGRRRATILGILLITITVGAHITRGLLPFGGNTSRVYKSVEPTGLTAFRAAQSVPRGGTLVCNRKLAVFCANREHLATWQYWKPDQHPADIFLVLLQEFDDPDKPQLISSLRDGSFGVDSVFFPYVVMTRGAITDRNAEILEMLGKKMLSLAVMATNGGQNRYVADVGMVRYWDGNGSWAPVMLAHGSSVTLAPGAYTAEFRYKISEPLEPIVNHLGWISIHRHRQVEPLSRAQISRHADNEDSFGIKALPFELTTPTRVEPRITGGDAQLWLLSVSFVTAQ